MTVLVSQGRFWRAALNKDASAVVLSVFKDALNDEFYDLKDLKLEVPLGKWNGVVKYVLSDRKLLGGMLLDHANHKGLVAVSIGNDRILTDLQRVIWEGTSLLIEEGLLALVTVESKSL